MRVFRHNVSGGVLGRELWYRADLEPYHKGNLVQENFVPTPYGGVMRRPGSERIAEHGTVSVEGVVYAPAAVRYFDFVYDRAAQYVVALMSYAAEGQDAWSRFEIFDTAGTLKDTVACDYAAADFFELADRQLNDVMYLTHTDYAPQQLIRTADEEWALEAVVFQGGPWLPWSSDKTTLSISKEAYDGAAVYEVGEVVHSGSYDKAVTAAAYVYWYYDMPFNTYARSYYLLRLTIGSHAINAGDVVTVSGFSGTSAELNGSYTVKKISSTTVSIYTGRHQNGWDATWYNNTPLPSSFTDETAGKNHGDAFFVSLQDENSGNALPVSPATETNWWRKTGRPQELTLTSSADLFTEQSIGQKVFAAVNIAQVYNGKFTAAGSESEWVAYSSGAVTLRTEGGVWDGICALQKSLDGGVTWETIGVINGGGGNHNGEITRDLADPEALLRVYMQTYKSVTGATGCMWQLEFPSGTPFICTITAVTDARTATVSAETALTALFQTQNWRLGAFSEANGYPGVVAIHDERLMLGGTPLQPFMVWGSAINNWENFAEGTLETSPLSLQANADRATRLCWLASKGELLFGTDFNEYSAGSRDSDTVMSAENPPKISVQNSYSSAPLPALLLGEDILFVQSDYKTLRSMAFSDAKWGYAGQNLTIFNPEIAGSGFRQLSVQKSPFPVIWAVTLDEQLISFTMDKENNIMGWATHPFAGADVVSSVVIPTLGNDTQYVCTRRGGVFQMEKCSWDNAVHLDDGGGTESAMTSLIQPTSLMQGPETLEEVRYRITKVYLYVKDSQGGEVSVDDGATWRAIEYESDALFTGKLEVAVNSGVTEKAPLQIRTTGTQPFNLLAVGIDAARMTTKD